MNQNISGPESDVIIRKMVPSDATDAAELSSELGYPVTAEAMEIRINQLAVLESHALYAACLGNRAVGWIDVAIANHLVSPPYGEIGGLVVSREHQGRGIGRRLVQAAETWIASHQIAKVLVRSRIGREGAHAFYLRQDFTRLKTSAVFTKVLDLSQT